MRRKILENFISYDTRFIQQQAEKHTVPRAETFIVSRNFILHASISVS